MQAIKYTDVTLIQSSKGIKEKEWHVQKCSRVQFSTLTTLNIITKLPNPNFVFLSMDLNAHGSLHRLLISDHYSSQTMVFNGSKISYLQNTLVAQPDFSPGFLLDLSTNYHLG